ncbi:T9SS type B sorting domain-containing protein [Flavivirga rizhaonensis]|uniref:T9SS type B sorting domain-containing protein n=1 Tax=Flavivirga rizhaonensis TaxID=2559571 RepID=A0A4S1DS43_9FLAO|nr:T9SS type B sorting domain-containing protein [Flavivirga rizhaonensis]TGV00761.1 T9SS type B sorting domain-containing protein [Flavivirga rizhaonensis]
MWVNRKYFCSLIFVLLSCIGISQTFVPDDSFEQKLINLGYDSGPLDDFVPTANISGITDLNIDFDIVDGLIISDLTGIEDFSALETLSCQSNNLTSIDVTQNTNLSQLFCGNNQLTSLDVTQNSSLRILWCNSNQIANLNVTQNSNLISLRCENNLLTNLDVTQNPRLNVFVCENNQITSLNVSQNSTLNRFQCGNNLLINLNVSNNLSLTFFTCENNQLTSLELSVNTQLANLNCALNQLTELNLSNNSNLTELNCSNNNLCRLNIRNGNNGNITLMDFRSNPDLNCVVVDNPSGNHSTWLPVTFSNYIASQNDCSNFVNVDSLDNVVTSTSYTLPALTNGTYFMQSGGNGIQLNTGDTITSSQTIYIYNETTCDNNESSFSVLIIDEDYYIPKYFTPNNDGSHDFWQVFDTNNSIKMTHIFDKYGKLLKSLPPNSLGWNGTFNGHPLSTDDYWYAITLNSGEVIRGHFALKR